MSLVDSEASFKSRCIAVGGNEDLWNSLKRHNIKTFSDLSFACGTPQAPPSDEAFRLFSEDIFGAALTLGQTSKLRLPGLLLEDELLPSHELVDAVAQMVEVDQAMLQLKTDPRVTMHLLPLPKSAAPASAPAEDDKPPAPHHQQRTRTRTPAKKKGFAGATVAKDANWKPLGSRPPVAKASTHVLIAASLATEPGNTLYFDAHQPQETEPWAQGERLVLVAYTMSGLDKLPSQDARALLQAGFSLPGQAGAAMPTPVNSDQPRRQPDSGPKVQRAQGPGQAGVLSAELGVTIEVFCGAARLSVALQELGFETIAIDHIAKSNHPVQTLDLTDPEQAKILEEIIENQAERIRLIHFAPPCG
ncbi:unnamed protein product, partial [Symbiodinium pilosum]